MALPSRDAARDEVLFCSSLAHSAVNYRGDFQDGRQPISSALQSVPGHSRFSSTARLLKVNKSPDWMTHSVKIKQQTGWFHEPSHRMNIVKLHRAEEIKNSVWNMNTGVQVVDSSSSVVLLTRVKPWKEHFSIGSWSQNVWKRLAAQVSASGLCPICVVSHLRGTLHKMSERRMSW